MIKNKIFNTIEELNTFEQSSRVVLISIETITDQAGREYFKLWYREVTPKPAAR